MDTNPLGLIGIDYLEFTCDQLHSPTKDLFYHLGFQKTHISNTGHQELFSQGQVRFLLNANPDHSAQARQYYLSHGEGVSKIAFLVENAERTIDQAIKRGATLKSDLITTQTEHGTHRSAAIAGFGDVVNEFIERPRQEFSPHFKNIESDPIARPLKSRFARIDHLTNNVPKGELDHWVDFYQRIYGFTVTRYFDIKGVKTGLESKVVQSANGAVIIPINEPEVENGKSQIQEFLDLHHGAGVQHIALTTADIVTTLEELHQRELKFLDVPDTYYEDIPKRGLKVEERMEQLQKNKILVDGDQEGYLLQIFSKPYIGPLFFEIIQRKKHMGFGEGNFQALFDAIERDQMKRGYL